MIFVLKCAFPFTENSSLCEEISQTTNELGTLKLQKHQATSPMLQASELQPLELNEVRLSVFTC